MQPKILMSDEDGTAVCSHWISFCRPLVSRCSCTCAASRGARAPDLPLPQSPYGGSRRHSPTRSIRSSDDPPAAVPGMGRVGDQNATLTHPTPTYTSSSFVRTFPMSDKDGAAVCSHWISFCRPLVSRCSCTCAASRGARAPELPLLQSPYGGSRRHSPTHPTWPHLASELSLPRTHSRPEKAFSDAPEPGNASRKSCPCLGRTSRLEAALSDAT